MMQAAPYQITDAYHAEMPIGECHLLDFCRWLNKTQGLMFLNYEALHHWSITNPEAFWQACLNFCDITLHRAPNTICKRGQYFWQDRWFPGAKLNYAENLLRYRDNHLALIFRDELGHDQQLSYARLYHQVAHLAHWLRAQGIKAGDRVAGFAANRIETIIAMLAVTSVGGVWTSCSPDFGVGGILDRFSQIEPVMLFAVSSHAYATKTFDHQQTLNQLISGLPSLRTVVLLPDLYGYQQNLPGNAGCRVLPWQSLPGLNPDDKTAAPALEFYAADFSDPLFIMYSSGTTGMPKCIVHSVGGTLVQHLKEQRLHVNLRRKDVLFFFTTCGWMMWNWLVSGLASGATLVLYDGSPFHPNPAILFDLARDTGVSIFGVSAKYLAAAEKAGVRPFRTHPLPRIHTLLSTGSPLSAEGFDYVRRDIKPNLMLQSISGGTDIISCFVLGNPVQPVHRGEIQCAGLGMDVAVFDDNGNAVREQKGELVCRQSFPSMPTGFWNDPDQHRFRAAYFERFENCWTHGDYAEQSANNGWIIYGRSDTVLNPGGVRIGTAEIYRQVELLPWVLESVAVAQQWENDVRIVLFVRLSEDLELDTPLQLQISQQIRNGASPRHVPAVILQVSDIPRTLNGKIAEIAVRETLHGRAVKNRDALANPESLREYEMLAKTLKS